MIELSDNEGAEVWFMLPISALYRSWVELRPSEAAERRIRRQGLQLYQAARIKLQPHFTFHIHTSHSAVDREQVASPLLSCGLTKTNVNKQCYNVKITAHGLHVSCIIIYVQILVLEV